MPTWRPDKNCHLCKVEQEMELLSKSLDAFIEGVTLYAWWKDGTQYVGTCGKTLGEAVREAALETFRKALDIEAKYGISYKGTLPGRRS